MLRDPQCPKSTVDGEESQGSAMMSLPQKGAAEQSLVPHLTPELEALVDTSVFFLGWSSLASVISKSLVTRMFNWEPASTSFLWGIRSLLGATVGNPLHQLSLGFPFFSPGLELLSLRHRRCPCPWTQFPCSGTQSSAFTSPPSVSQGSVF